MLTRTLAKEKKGEREKERVVILSVSCLYQCERERTRKC